MPTQFNNTEVIDDFSQSCFGGVRRAEARLEWVAEEVGDEVMGTVSVKLLRNLVLKWRRELEQQVQGDCGVD